MAMPASAYVLKRSQCSSLNDGPKESLGANSILTNRHPVVGRESEHWDRHHDPDASAVSPG